MPKSLVVVESPAKAKTINKYYEVLYINRNVDSSIVNTLSKNHVYGYLNAWPTISQFLEQQGVCLLYTSAAADE